MMKMIEAVLKEHNAVGIENALTITELCILTGKTIREITKAVEDERKSGVLICSRMEGKGDILCRLMMLRYRASLPHLNGVSKASQ